MSGHLSQAERVIVVGTGPAGSSAAVFLSRAGVKPLILEAGAKRHLGFMVRVAGVTVGKRQPVLRERAGLTRTGDPRAQLFEALAAGGLSNHWACAVPRFSDEDFQDAARAGIEQTWPVGYADLAPWYDAVEPLLRIAAGTEDSVHLPRSRAVAVRNLGADWSPVVESARRHGRAVLAMPYANGASTMVTRSATAFNAYSQLLVPAERAQQVEVRPGCEVERLEWSARERRVTAVICRDARTGSESRLPCRAVVLAAGAVNSARLLLQSTSADFPQGLGNQHGVVGRYLNDHPLAKLVVELAHDVTLSPASYVTRSGLEGSEPLYATGCMQWSSSALLARSVLERRPFKTRTLGFSVFGTMLSRPENFVALDPSAGRSRILMSLQHEPMALTTLERGRDELLAILRDAGWAPREQVWNVEPPGNSVHYAGTCRMHANPRFGVVDARCRVHGVPNVAIADSSVFTTGPEKNPVLTAMALAARAGHHLAQDVNDGSL